MKKTKLQIMREKSEYDIGECADVVRKSNRFNQNKKGLIKAVITREYSL